MTDPILLNAMVQVHPQAMDIAAIEEFAADSQSSGFADGAPLFKLWIIRSTAPGKIYMVFKIHHSVIDGLDLMQIFSLMQDDTAAMVSNAI